MSRQLTTSPLLAGAVGFGVGIWGIGAVASVVLLAEDGPELSASGLSGADAPAMIAPGPSRRTDTTRWLITPTEGESLMGIAREHDLHVVRLPGPGGFGLATPRDPSAARDTLARLRRDPRVLQASRDRTAQALHPDRAPRVAVDGPAPHDPLAEPVVVALLAGIHDASISPETPRTAAYDFVDLDTDPTGPSADATAASFLSTWHSADLRAPVSLMPVRVADDDGAVSTSALADGIAHAVAKGADVIWLGARVGPAASSKAVAQAIDAAIAADVVLVGAADSEQPWTGRAATQVVTASHRPGHGAALLVPAPSSADAGLSLVAAAADLRSRGALGAEVGPTLRTTGTPVATGERRLAVAAARDWIEDHGAGVTSEWTPSVALWPTVEVDKTPRGALGRVTTTATVLDDEGAPVPYAAVVGRLTAEGRSQTWRCDTDADGVCTVTLKRRVPVPSGATPWVLTADSVTVGQTPMTPLGAVFATEGLAALATDLRANEGLALSVAADSGHLWIVPELAGAAQVSVWNGRETGASTVALATDPRLSELPLEAVRLPGAGLVRVLPTDHPGVAAAGLDGAALLGGAIPEPLGDVPVAPGAVLLGDKVAVGVGLDAVGDWLGG